MAEKVALLKDIKTVADDIFANAGFEVIHFPKFISEQELADLAQDVTILGVRSGPEVPASVMEGSKLQAIGGFCVNPKVDFKAANQEGVAVFNSIHENTRSVTEHVIGNVFNLMRRTAEHNQQMHAGVWSKTDEFSYEVRGKTMGIIGYGNIGAQVSVEAEKLGMDVVYYDPATIFPSFGRAERLPSLEAVLSTADVVTLHVPDIPSTRQMINASTLALMKPGSYLINAARGELLDYDAVEEALDSRQLGGLALDVHLDEPKQKGDPVMNRFQGRPNVVLTPHIAGSTEEAQTKAGAVVAQKLVAYKHTGNPYGSLTLPKAKVEILDTDNRRLVYIHNDEPGAMTDVHAILSEAGCNVVGEGLKVDKELGSGFAYLDIENGKLTSGVLDSIRNLATTRKAWVIG